MAACGRSSCGGLASRLSNSGSEQSARQTAELRKVAGRQVARTPAREPRVERDHDPLEAGGFGTPHETLGEFAIGGA